ncbi:AfsR/SARP family transcriptional regulator [Bailinhaonella thermotolerans]|uniref:ATPase n=1 Tax=Bailinhaonella thermotolerans TaxID=1070861 RepID=A0A3A4ADF0_9ACTN|nr:AfsR/SARP family transcriptional regulator [Bailinhaonella thermotolerans]RJL26461.1 ATPase [Bailinhaonella thermotolerans]
MDLRFRVLGPFTAESGGRHIDLGGPRQRSVLARLVAARGQVVSVDRLIDDLYAEEVPPRALAALQAYVSNLRRAIEPDRAPRTPARVLVTAPPGYAVRLDADAVDVWVFESLIRRGGALLDEGDARTAAAVLAEALALWGGPAYQEFADLAWAAGEAVRVEELRMVAVERSAAAGLRLGLAVQVVPELERLVAEQPLREEAWRLLALALYRCGRQGDALGALRRARTALVDELGVDPGPALQRLETDILAQAAHLDEPRQAPPATIAADPAQPGPEPAAGPAGPVLEPIAEPAAEPFVGREGELARLSAIADQAAAGRFTIALVQGEPGAGKTALARTLGAGLAGRGWTVAWGRCPEAAGAPAAWPWAELLSDLTGRFAPEDRAALNPLLDEAGEAQGGDVAAARFRLHRAVGRYLAAVAGRAPLLLVLDDLHRADEETLALLGDLPADLAPARVLVVGTYRPSEEQETLRAGLAALARHDPHRLDLPGLAADGVAALVRAVCTREVTDETVRVIVARTGGNPFFVRETARLLDSEGVLVATSEVPCGVRDVIRRRVARLPASAQTVLRHAAVVGWESDVDVLIESGAGDEDTVIDAIESGLVTGLMLEPEAGRVRFTHGLIRDTLYEDISRLRRSRLHARVAEAIERKTPHETASLAYHFAQAATPETAARAVPYARMAAERAERGFAHRKAVTLWEQALDCFDRARLSDPRERLELVMRLVRAFALTGDLAQARAHRDHAILLARPLADPCLTARVIASFDVPTLWISRSHGAGAQELIEIIEQTLRELPAEETELRCRLLTTLAFELEGDPAERGYEASIEAVALAWDHGDPELLAMALNGRYVQAFRYGGLDERLEIGRMLLKLAARHGLVTVEMLAHLILMQVHCGRVEYDRADGHASAARELAERYDLPLPLALIGYYDGLRIGVTGDFARAEAVYGDACARMGQVGAWGGEVAMLGVAVFCHRLAQDRLHELADSLERLHSDPRWREFVAEPYALALARSGRLAEARQVAAARRPLRRGYFWHLMAAVRGLLGVELGDRARVEEAYQTLLPFKGVPVGAMTGAVQYLPTDQVLGDLALYRGEPETAREHHRDALAVAERAGSALWRDAALAALGEGGQPNTRRSSAA